MFWLVSILVTLAWGVGAFGSPYPWAYIPLLIASAVLGSWGLWLGRTRASFFKALILSLVLIAFSTAAQIVPVPLKLIDIVSPHAATILNQRSIEFSLGQSAYHSLSIEPSRTTLGLSFLAAFAMLLLGTGCGLRRHAASTLAGSLVFLGVAVAIIGIVQRATFNGKIYGFWENVQQGAVFGPFVNRNHFAGWMLMVIPVGLGYFCAIVARGMEGRKPGLRNFVLWFSTESASRATLTGFGILLMALSLLLTMSRSGMIALLAAVVVAGSVMARRQSGISRRAVTVGYLAFLIVAAVSWVGLDQIISRFAEADVASIYERPAIWADTIRIVKDFWLTGTGLNTYGVSTLFYQTSAPGKHLREAHSDYLQLAAEGGLLVGIPIVISVAAFARTFRKRLREDIGTIQWIRMGAITGLGAIAVQSLVEFSLQMPGNAALFAVIAGVAVHDSKRT